MVWQRENLLVRKVAARHDCTRDRPCHVRAWRSARSESFVQRMVWQNRLLYGLHSCSILFRHALSAYRCRLLLRFVPKSHIGVSGFSFLDGFDCFACKGTLKSMEYQIFLFISFPNGFNCVILAQIRKYGNKTNSTFSLTFQE